MCPTACCSSNTTDTRTINKKLIRASSKILSSNATGIFTKMTGQKLSEVSKKYPGFHAWYTTDEELSHVNEILGTNFDRMDPSHKVAIMNMDADRFACPNCAKLSGIDDVVENAVRLGIHSREFIRDTFLGINVAETPQKANLDCSRCHTSFGQEVGWSHPAGRWPSNHDDE